MLDEPASALTDFALSAVALAATIGLVRDPLVHRHWVRGLGAIALASLLGGLYHGFIVTHGTAADVTWAAITVIVAIALSLFLAGSVANVLGKGRGKPLLWIRTVSLVAFFFAAALGHATVTALVITEALAMAMVLGLWLHAWRTGRPGVGLMLGAIAASAAAGLVKGVAPGFEVGGWELDTDTLYHLAQIPGIVVLYVGVRAYASVNAGARTVVAWCSGNGKLRRRLDTWPSSVPPF